MTDGHGVNVHIPSRQAVSPGRSITTNHRRSSCYAHQPILAIALSATAIVSVSVPAAAHPLSQVFGGNSRIVAQIHPMQATAITPTSQNANRPKIGVDYPTKVPTGAPVYSGLGKGGNLIPAKPTGPVYSGLGPDGKLIQAKTYPAGDASTGTKTAQIPIKNKPDCVGIPQDLCGRLPPPTPPAPLPPGPPPPPPPHPHPDPGPVVIVVPPAPIQAPVVVPVPVRVNTGTAAPAQPVITPNCMTTADIPALAAGIDQLLPTAQLSEADMTRVIAIRQSIQELATIGKVADARDLEEIAMKLLGYQKVWLRCGQGTFAWQPLIASTQAIQAK